MINPEEISAVAQESVLKTSLDDGVEEDICDVINLINQGEDGDRIKSGDLPIAIIRNCLVSERHSQFSRQCVHSMSSSYSIFMFFLF